MASTMPITTRRMAANRRNTSLSRPMAKPTVATNRAIAVKEIASPPASAAGASRCSDAADASTIGKSGSTQGESAVNAPATNERPRLAALIGSKALGEQRFDGCLARVANRAANLAIALEHDQRALLLYAEHAQRIFLAIEIDHEDQEILELRLGNELVQDRRLRPASRAPRGRDIDEDR